MTGLKRGTVKLIPHQEEWDQNAKEMKELAQVHKNTRVK